MNEETETVVAGSFCTVYPMICQICGQAFNAAGWPQGKQFVCKECEGKGCPDKVPASEDRCPKCGSVANLNVYGLLLDGTITRFWRCDCGRQWETPESAKGPVPGAGATCTIDAVVTAFGNWMHVRGLTGILTATRTVEWMNRVTDAARKVRGEPTEARTVVCPPGTEFILPGYQQAVSELLAAFEARILPDGLCEWIGGIHAAARKVREAQGTDA